MLLPLRPGDSGEPALFLVHPASGNALVYQELAAAFGDGAGAVFGVHAPLLESDGTAFASIEQIAETYVDAVRRAQPQGPYLLAGWSLGGVVAYEMARQLVDAGESIGMLALLDTWAPVASNAALYAATDEAELLVELAEDHEIPLTAGELHGLDRDARLQLLLDRGRTAHVIPPGLGLRDVERLVRTYRVLLEQVQHYVARPSAVEPVLIRAEQTLRDAPDADPALCWNEICATPVRALESSGAHRTMVFGPNAAVLASRLRPLAWPPRAS